MSGSSRFSQLAEAGEIERRLQALEKGLNIAGVRAATSVRDTPENLSDAIASALTGWADRFRQGASTVGDQSSALGRDAARLGTVAINRIADETDGARYSRLLSRSKVGRRVRRSVGECNAALVRPHVRRS
jgi:hypothetical protein